MIKLIQFILCALIFCSCSRTESSVHKNNSKIVEPESICFSDIIPENYPDSLKIKIISKLVDEIRTDTTLIYTEIEDTLSTKIYAFYRNDSLVKVMKGNMSYYFLMDRLIFAQYACSVIQHTGRCNPVSAYSVFCFYNHKVIYQSHDVNIGFPYQVCGCMDYSVYEKEGKVAQFEALTKDEVYRLKERIKSHVLLPSGK